MYLYNIEYTVKKTNCPWIAKIVGASREDIIENLTRSLGEIHVDSICYIDKIDRITATVMNQITDYLLKTEPKKKTGRPRKYDFWSINNA